MTTKRQLLSQLKKGIAAMPKCPTCGGFALPSTRVSENGQFVCATHGRFTPKEQS